MNPKQISYPKIGQFRNVITTLSRISSFKGMDVNGNPIYDETAVKPKIKFKGTVKVHGCFAKTSLITMANGERVEIGDIKKGDSILSFDLENNKQVISKVSNTFVKEIDKEWIKLYFDNGSFIECTKDHKFYTKNRGFVEADLLNETDEFEIDAK